MQDPSPASGDSAGRESDEGVVALDIGGMSIRSGVVEPGRQVRGVERRRIDHRASRQALVECIWSSISSCGPGPGSRIAIAVPGPFDYAAGVSMMEHKLMSLAGVDLRAALSSRAETPDLDVRSSTTRRLPGPERSSLRTHPLDTRWS